MFVIYFIDICSINKVIMEMLQYKTTLLSTVHCCTLSKSLSFFIYPQWNGCKSNLLPLTYPYNMSPCDCRSSCNLSRTKLSSKTWYQKKLWMLHVLVPYCSEVEYYCWPFLGLQFQKSHHNLQSLISKCLFVCFFYPANVSMPNFTGYC